MATQYIKYVKKREFIFQIIGGEHGFFVNEVATTMLAGKKRGEHTNKNLSLINIPKID